MADPTTVILAHVEVIIVAQFETSVAEFTIAAVKRFL